MVVGHAMLSQGPAVGLLPIALHNDHHFWGVAVIEADKIAHLDKLIGAEDWISFPGSRGDVNRSCDNDSDDDYYTPIPTALDMTPAAMSTEEVDAELQLCGCLASWSPWDTPTEEVNNSLATIRMPTTARRCMLREQVIGDLIWEASNSDTIPVRLQYNAAARYRLKKGRLSPMSHVSKKN